MGALEKKIPPPILMIVFAVLIWVISLFSNTITWSFQIRIIVSLLLLLLSVSISISAIRTFRKVETTVNPLHPETASILVSEGIFSISRNPMYIGLALILVAWSVFLATVWGFLLVFLFILYLNRFQIIPEERALKKLFGLKYEDYLAKVRRWI